MSTQAIPQPELDEVQHPTLGTLKFPKDMPFDQRNQIIDGMVKDAQPKEGKFTRFMHGAGLPGTAEEFRTFLPYSDEGASPSPFSLEGKHPGRLLSGALNPKPSPGHPEEGMAVLGPILRAQRETWEKPGVGNKILSMVPILGPIASGGGEALERGDYAGAGGAEANMIAQTLGLKYGAEPYAPQLADASGTALRTGVKAVNKTLEKAPGTIGAGLGAAAAHEVGVPPWIGGGIGAVAGKELLPKLRIPGEKVGLGPRPPLSFGSHDAIKFLHSPGIEGEIPPALPTSTELPPAPYRLSGTQLTQPATAMPRRILGPERQLPPHVDLPAAEPPVAPVPLKAKTVAGQNTEILKRAGVAGPRATQTPLQEIPSGALKPDPKLSFANAKNGESALRQQITSHPINKLRAIAVQRGLKVAASDTNEMLIKKIADSATEDEVSAFEQARVERMQPRYGERSGAQSEAEGIRKAQGAAARGPQNPWSLGPSKTGFGTAKQGIEETPEGRAMLERAKAAQPQVPTPENIEDLLRRSILLRRKP